MHVGIFGTGLTDSSERILKKILDENHISSSKIGTKSKNKKSDCVFVLGGDKGVRNYFHRTFDASIPVLGINESESDGFLSQLDLKQLPSLISRIKKMDFETEQVTRLGVKIDGKNVYPVLNDVAVFSSRIRESEKEWIRYVLVIGDKEVNSENLSVRDRTQSDVRDISFDDFINEIQTQNQGKPNSTLNLPPLLSKRPIIQV